jgi:PKD repeat protein
MQNPTHTYTEPGVYDVTLSVVDSYGTSDHDITKVTVYSPDTLFADAGGPYYGIVGEDIYFIGTVIGGVAPYLYIWDFGDESPLSIDQNTDHIYEEVGNYSLTLTVIDDEGKSDENIVEVIIVEPQEDEVIIKDIEGGLGVKATIVTGDYPVNWEIVIEGNFVFGNKLNSGSIRENSVETIKSKFVFGFGKINITIKASSLEEKRTALLLGPFVLSLK